MMNPFGMGFPGGFPGGMPMPSPADYGEEDDEEV